MTKEEILDLIKEKETAARSQEIDAEQRSALLDEIKDLKEQLKTAESRANQIPNIDMNRFISRGNDEPEDLYGTVEYRNAWFESVREGTNDAVRRFISSNDSGTSKGGKILVPTMLVNQIEHAIREGGHIISLCNITDYAGLISIPYEIDGGEEGTERVEGSNGPEESEIKLGEATLKPTTIVKWVSITKEMEVMSIEAFADYMTNLLVDRILLACDRGVIAGPQADKGFNGITTNTDKNIVAEYKGPLEFGTGFIAQGKLNDLADPVVVMNKQTFYTNIMQMKDTTGQPIFKTVIDPMTGKAVNYYNGMKVVFSNILKDYASAVEDDVYMLVADFKGYRANFPNGFAVSLLRDPYTQGVDGKIRYIADIMAGGNVTKLKYFCTIKKPA